METSERFKDPLFVGIWERWQRARGEWDRCSKHVPFAQLPKGIHNPEPDAIVNQVHRSTAREFVEARAAYLQVLVSDSEEVSRG
jgi:hypothetical protein